MEEVPVTPQAVRILGQIFMPMPIDKDADNLQVVLSMQGSFKLYYLKFTYIVNLHAKY